MVDMVSTLTNVGRYDNYIVEIRYPDRLEDDITDTLDRNLEEVGSSIGEGNVYVKPLDPSVTEELLERIDREIDMYSMPWLLLLDKHPTEVESGDEGILLELGETEGSQDVNQALREIRRAMNDEAFARRLTIQQKLDYLKDKLSKLARAGGLGLTAATFL